MSQGDTVHRALLFPSPVHVRLIYTGLGRGVRPVCTGRGSGWGPTRLRCASGLYGAGERAGPHQVVEHDRGGVHAEEEEAEHLRRAPGAAG
jgi:hypothetical protein